jgi:hypothetical protein
VARRFFAFALLSGLLAFAGCTGQKSAAPAPIDQIPSPEFSTKPQIYFVVDSSERYWNLPIPEELELKHRVRVTLFESSDPAALENALRDFNGREAMLLIFSGKRLLETAKKLSVFSHPSGRKTFYFESAGAPPLDTPSLKLDLSSPQKMLGTLCPQWKKSHRIVCSWDERIAGIPSPTQREAKDILLPIGFDALAGTQDTDTRLRLKLDWVQWFSQFLRTASQGGVENWRVLNLENGSLRLDVLNPRPEMPTLKESLQAERLKNL